METKTREIRIAEAEERRKEKEEKTKKREDDRSKEDCRRMEDLRWGRKSNKVRGDEKVGARKVS